MKQRGKYGSSSNVAYSKGLPVFKEFPVHISVRTPTHNSGNKSFGILQAGIRAP
jgi:hypothetical protein